MRSLSLLWVVAPACFSPSPPTGVPCQTDPDCPPPQVCDLATQTCQLTSSPADSAIDPDAPPDAAAFDCWAAWKSGAPTLTDPVIATSLNSPAREQDPTFTRDALGVYIVRGDVIMFATRASRTVAFDLPVTVTELMSGAGETRLTEALNGQVAVFESRRTGGEGGSDLWWSARTTGGTFDTPSQLGLDTVNDAGDQFDPELTEDSLHLYWSAPNGFAGRVIFFASRESVTEPFGTATVLPIDINGQVFDPALSPDELVMIFGAPSGVGANDLHFATRASTELPFTSRGKIEKLDVIASQGDPDISDDGCTLIFGSDRLGGQGNRDLWMTDVVID